MYAEYKDLLSVFGRYRVRYLVVGAYAVMRYTEPRYTKDLDVWVDPAPDNAERVYRALADFGAPVRDFTPSDFTDRYSAFQIGVEPVRIDILIGLAGMRFSSAWKKRRTSRIDGVTVHFISKADLIRSKKAAGRRRDLDDIDGLTGKS